MALLLNPRQTPKQRPDQSRALGTPGKHLWIWPPLCLDPELARRVWGSDFCPSVQKKVACLTQEPGSFHPPAPTVTSLSRKTAPTAAGTTAPGVSGKRGGRADEVGRDPPRSRLDGPSEIAAHVGESGSETQRWLATHGHLPVGLMTHADHPWTGGPRRGPVPVARPPHLVNIPDLPAELGLLVVEVCPREQLLVHLALPLSPGGDGISAGDGQLHVPDHLLLLLQELPMLDLGAQGRRLGRRGARATSHRTQLNQRGTREGDAPGKKELGGFVNWSE